jgi:hypothetical protein
LSCLDLQDRRPQNRDPLCYGVVAGVRRSPSRRVPCASAVPHTRRDQHLVREPRPADVNRRNGRIQSGEFGRTRSVRKFSFIWAKHAHRSGLHATGSLPRTRA